MAIFQCDLFRNVKSKSVESTYTSILFFIINLKSVKYEVILFTSRPTLLHFTFIILHFTFKKHLIHHSLFRILKFYL